MSVRNLNSIFAPRSVALIGASREPHTVGEVLAQNLLGSSFAGPVFFVNPKARAIHSVLAYDTVSALPHAPDLAVIATPPATIPGLIAELGAMGTRGAIVISAGFSEAGRKGEQLQGDLLMAARPHLLRIVGPNCLGVQVPGARLNASFAHIFPRPGPLAVVAQSGAILTAILDWGEARGLGFSHLVSLGGTADVDFGDMLDYLAAEPQAQAILLYIESIRDARKFMSAARRAARIKPVIAIKAGRQAEGAKAALSHTGALAGADQVYDAALRRAGILRVMSIEELFDAAQTLAHIRTLKGDRVAILTNGGGLGVLAVDRLIDEGGHLASLSPESLKKLDEALPRTWSHGNPIDLIGDADASRYRSALDILFEDRGVDAILALNCPVAIVDSAEPARAVAACATRHRDATDSPALFASWLGDASQSKARAILTEAGIPHYPTPENAVQGLMHIVRFQSNQALLMETPPAQALPDRNRVAARRVIDAALAEGRAWLSEIEAKKLLTHYGIPSVDTHSARTGQEASKIAAEIGFPVAIKILSPQITHKTDVGGVVLNLKDQEAVRAAADDMLARVASRNPSAVIEGVTVQRMASRPGAHELICGLLDDPVFGPVILFGQGGTAVEVLRDKAIALPPLNPILARELIERTRIAKLLKGYRDRPAADSDAIVRVLLALQDIAADCPEVVELDINPLWADQAGVLALDARVRLARPERSGTQRFAIKPYPTDLEGEISDREGRRYALKPVRPEDASGLKRLVEQSNPEDNRLRFFTALRALPESLAKRLSQIDYDREMAFVAYERDAVAGVARLSCDPDFARAEFAVMVRSDLKGRGLGRVLMERLIAYARARRIAQLFGDILSENQAMRALCGKLGFAEAQKSDEAGVVEATLSL